MAVEGTPCAVKVARTVWSGGKPGDNIKWLPITILLHGRQTVGKGLRHKPLR